MALHPPRAFQYRVYRQLIASYLVLAITTIAALSLILFSLFSASALGEISANSLVLLDRTAVAADILDDEVVTIGGHLVNEIDVVSFLFSKHDSKIMDFNAMRVLDRTQSVYPFIRSIGLYNGHTGSYYNNLGMLSRIPAAGFARISGSLLPRVIPADASPDKKPHAVLTRMIFPYATTVDAACSAIELNIDERYMRSIIASLSGHVAGTVTMVLDSRGTVLSHEDPALFLSDASGQPYVRRILAERAARGSFVDVTDGEKRLVTFVRSPNSGWSFVMTQRYAALIGNIDRLKTITLLVALCLAILGGGLSALMTLMVHSPLRRLVEGVASRARTDASAQPAAGARPGTEVEAARPGDALDEYALIADTLARYDHTADELRRSLRASLPLMRESWVLGLLTGESREGIIPDRTLAELDAGLAAPPYVVVTLRIDSYEQFRAQRNPGAQEGARRDAARVVRELCARHHPCDSVVMSENELALLASVPADPSVDGMLLALAEIQHGLHERTGLSFTMGIGDLAYTREEIHRSCASGAERCRYRIFLGPGSIIDERSVHARRAALSSYPKNVEERIVERLRHGEADAIRESVDEFVREIAGLSYYPFMNFVGRLLLAIFWQFGESTDLLDLNYRDHDRLLRDVESSETLAELSRKVADFGCRVASLIGGQAGRAHVRHNERIVEDVRRIVAERFAEPGLSLDIVADSVGLSAGYLARLFKLVAGQSFGDHLNGVRLARARELLTATTRSAQAIGESVGIYNATYFSTLFKKAYGISPSRYRERAVAERRA